MIPQTIVSTKHALHNIANDVFRLARPSLDSVLVKPLKKINKGAASDIISRSKKCGSKLAAQGKAFAEIIITIAIDLIKSISENLLFANFSI